MMITYLIIGFVVVMLIGNLMSARPKDSELVVETLRLLARKIGLMPKLSPIPTWLNYPIKDNDSKLVMIYTLVNDDWRLPLVKYVKSDNAWQLANELADIKQDKQANKSQRLVGKIDLPQAFVPYVSGLFVRANSISLVFDDIAFIKSITKNSKTKTPNNNELQSHLDNLKQALMAWGHHINKE